MEDKRLLFIYGIKNDRLEIIERVAFAHGFGVREIGEEQLDWKVSDILDGQGEPDDGVRSSNITFDDDFEYMLFVNIHDELLYNFLEEIKKEGVYVPHKAVLTETNKNWPLSYLMNENKEEHKVMSLYSQLRKVMGVGQGLIEKTHDEELIGIMEEAQDYFHPREFEFEELRDIYNRLAQKINELLSQQR